MIALDWRQPSPSAVGAYAAAVGMAALAQVLATHINCVYARHLSVRLEQRDFETLQALRGQRLRWLAAPLTVYFVGPDVHRRR